MGNQILIAGYIGFGNAGDEAIAEIIVRHLRDEIPGVEITILSGNPQQTAAAFDVRAIGWREPLEIVNAIRQADLTIIGGGGLFQDYWGFDPDAVMTREHWGLSFYVAPVLVAALCGKPVMLYAVGAGPLLSEHGRKFTKVAGDLATRITVRDRVTQELFESLGVRREKITLTADPAFDVTPVALSEPVPEVEEWLAARPAIALCLRGWMFGTDRTFAEREIAAAIDQVLDEGGRALFLPFHYEPGTDDDVAAARRVSGMLRNREKVALLERPLAAGELAALIGRADLVLGMRLHSIIFSLAAAVPVIGIEYDPKIGGLAGLAGLEQFTVPLGGIEADVLAGRMRDALRNPEPFRQLADPRREELRRNARKNAAVAAELMREGAAAPDFTAEAHALLGRWITAQIATREALPGKVQEALGWEMREPLQMAALLTGIREIREQLREQSDRAREFEAAAATAQAQSEELVRVRENRVWLEENIVQLEQRIQQAEESHREELQRLRREMERSQERSSSEFRGVTGELQRARVEAEAAQRKFVEANTELYAARSARQEAEVQVGSLTTALASARSEVARLGSRAPDGLAKRALHLILDVLQRLTPAPLRASVRKHYLNWFYFRVFPDRRPHSGRAS